jgi:hypothetical protein
MPEDERSPFLDSFEVGGGKEVVERKVLHKLVVVVD